MQHGAGGGGMSGFAGKSSAEPVLIDVRREVEAMRRSDRRRHEPIQVALRSRMAGLVAAQRAVAAHEEGALFAARAAAIGVAAAAERYAETLPSPLEARADQATELVAELRALGVRMARAGVDPRPVIARFAGELEAAAKRLG